MTIRESAVVRHLPGNRPPAKPAVREAVASVVKRVAPLWPLDQFVAVNPFLGFAEERFEAASRRVSLACDGRMLMPVGFYRDALAEGRITAGDLQAAIARRDLGEQFRADDLQQYLTTGVDTESKALPHCAEVCGQISDQDWSGQVLERVSHWAAGYFDAGQASWPSPFAHLRPYSAWKQEAAIDCSDTILGLHGAQEQLGQLPDSPEALCEYALQRLAVPESLLELYLHRLLMSVGGWVAYARYQSWQQELAGNAPEFVVDLLAVRLAWELLLLRAYTDEGAELAWRRAINLALPQADTQRPLEREEWLKLLIHEAYEQAWERGAITALRGGGASAAVRRPDAQAVFCIDVRSEVFRRALESVNDRIETLGFAGFFGLPVEYIPLDGQRGPAHCPVLLEPALAVREAVHAQPEDITERLSRRVRLRRQLSHGWRAFRSSAVSCFVFVESYGLAYALKLAAHSLGLSRPEPHPRHRGLPPRLARDLGPQLRSLTGGEEVGLDRQIEFAESILRGMSLTKGFAPLVLLAGHGSTTTNNAHGAGLDCGACGGQTGEASARIAALILNNPAVREALAERGLGIPEDTVFVAALHNTTTDEFSLFDEDGMPPSHYQAVKALRRDLAEAGNLARGERRQLLALAPNEDVHAAVLRKSRDWSDVRPEWGLAGCAGFIAAPRELSQRLDLGGRSFLHSYDYREDKDFSVLELIMTAPMVVASWISLQYYGSTVDNQRFGSGNKTLHNVVGASIGVFEGNGGDLRVGLPLQSVHNGEKPVHEPMRLSVFLAAPIAAINDILERHEHVRHLADNGWLKLFAVYDDGAIVVRYAGDLHWEPVTGQDTP